MLEGKRIGEYISNVKSTPKEIEYLFAGDSHGSDDINKNLLPDGYYNISRPSDNLKDIYCKLLYLMSQGRVIKNLVIETDPQLYSNYRLNLNNNDLAINYLNYREYSKIFQTNFLEYYIMKFPLMSQKNRNFIFKASFKKIIKYTSNKYKALIGVPNKIEKSGNSSLLNNENSKAKVIYHFSKGALNNNEIIHYFLKIKELTEANKINLIGIRFPVSKNYIDQLEKSIYSKTETEITVFLKEHISTSLNYRNLFIENPEYFLDTDHLNINGSRIFTKIVIKDLNNQEFELRQ